jgi:hypothetical protein
MPEQELARLEESIAERSESYPVVPGAGGIRKARWGALVWGRGAVSGRYYFAVRSGIVYMLDIYAKNEKADLTPEDRRKLRMIAKSLEG